MRGVLCLEDGFAVQGELTNYTAEAFGEVVFFTGMNGYEGVLTDPSCSGQILVFTFPMVGTYGLPQGSTQSPRITVQGVVARESSLKDVSSPVIQGLNTRELVLHLREHGCQKGVIAALPDSGLTPSEISRLKECAAQYDGTKVVESAGCQEITLEGEEGSPRGTCVLMDLGAKSAIVKRLLAMGYRVVRVPSETSATAILEWNPACVVVSSGPGDPCDRLQAIETIAGLLGRVPVFGISLGHQILAKAAGARTIKLKFGHHGEQTVKEHLSGRTFVTPQNHNYAVDEASLPATAFVTHTNITDGTVEGLEIRERPGGRILAASVQFNPEGAPGPQYRPFWARVEGGDFHA